ncbi:hypothetical protein C0J52_08147 [Blattella germanica]|nr:hypothetical protein C0J52_08147 [Blattella germanica]
MRSWDQSLRFATIKLSGYGVQRGKEGGAGGATKVLTTMKTMPPNMVTVSKASGVGGKQTIVITKPGPGMTGVAGTAGMSVGMPGRSTGGPQIIVVTTASGLRTVQAL